MEARQMLAAKSFPETGTIHVEGMFSNKVTILGASVPMSAQTGDYVTSFYVTPEKGKKGLVAVTVTQMVDAKRSRNVQFLLAVSYVDDKPYIDFVNAWVPLPGRLGQATDYGLAVDIMGMRFVTKKPYHYDKDTPEPVYCFVPDGNVVCKYLAGDIEADEVLTAAMAWQEEVQARKRLPEIEKELATAKRDMEAVQVAFDRVKASLDDARSARYALSEKLSNLMMATGALLVEAKKRRIKSRAFSKAISEAHNKMSA